MFKIWLFSGIALVVLVAISATVTRPLVDVCEYDHSPKYILTTESKGDSRMAYWKEYRDKHLYQKVFVEYVGGTLWVKIETDALPSHWEFRWRKLDKALCRATLSDNVGDPE